MAILNQIYEEAFLGFSYGFRPGRSQHDALDALATGILRQPINWVLDLDVVRCFDSFDRAWLERFLQHRIGDRRLLRLIRKWLKAGVLEDEVVSDPDRGVVQGAVVRHCFPMSICIMHWTSGCINGGDATPRGWSS